MYRVKSFNMFGDHFVTRMKLWKRLVLVEINGVLTLFSTSYLTNFVKTQVYVKLLWILEIRFEYLSSKW